MRARILIEAELIEANIAARRCVHVVDSGRSRWDAAHGTLNVLLHEWTETVRLEAGPAAVAPEPA